MRKYKLVFLGEDARIRLYRGVKKVAEAVGSTLGPFGLNAIIQRNFRTPRITNDGVTIAKNILPLKDEVENLGAEAITDAADKTNDRGGDGTSTTTELAWAIIKKAFGDLDEPNGKQPNIIGASDSMANMMQIRQELRLSYLKVIEKLKLMAKPIETLKELQNIAKISVEDEEFGNIIGEMVHKIGKDGFISVEESYSYDHEWEVVSGMKVRGKYAAPFLITNFERKRTEIEKSPILITNCEIDDSMKSLFPIVSALQMNKDATGRPEPIKTLTIIAPKFSKQCLIDIAATAKTLQKYPDGSSSNFVIWALKAPSLKDEELEDLAIYTNSKFLDKTKGMSIAQAKWSDLGSAEKVFATFDDIIVMGGGGDQKKTKERKKLVQKLLDNEKDKMFRLGLEKRIASLSSGVGRIGIGSKSDLDRIYIKLKVEDAVYATQAALDEGVVRGGGLALKEASEVLNDSDFLKSILSAPYERIQKNAGVFFEIADNVFDPVKITRIALENAVIFASTFITVNTAIAEREEGIDQLRDLLREPELKRPSDDLDPKLENRRRRLTEDAGWSE